MPWTCGGYVANWHMDLARVGRSARLSACRNIAAEHPVEPRQQTTARDRTAVFERGFAADCGRCRRLHSYSLLDDAVQRRLAVCSLCAEGQQQECRVDADVWSSQGWRDGCSICSQPQKRETQASMRACMRSARTHSSKMRRPVSWSNSHVLSTGRTVESWPSFTIVQFPLQFDLKKL